MPFQSKALRNCLQCGREFINRYGARSSSLCSVPCTGRYRVAHAPDRFWANVQKTDSCWLWTGRKSSNGYGEFKVDSRGTRAHRFSWELHNGPIPPGLFVCHRCDVKLCVRPEHLYPGTAAQNTKDAVDRGLMPSGERHGSRTKPDRVPRGERHGSRTHPERVLRGDRHYARVRPELHTRGETHSTAKLTTADVLAIRDAYPVVSRKALAEQYGMSVVGIGHIVTRRTWRHI